MATLNSTGFSAKDAVGQRSSGERSRPQIAWLQPTSEQRALVSRLARCFDECGLAPGITAFVRTADDDLPDFDLLLLEYTRSSQRELAHTVRKIRSRSTAPVVVFVRAETPDLTVAALGAGADLVLSLNTSEEVITARCRALLRRWCASLHQGRN
jgi:DNA-binding response OmpR family regulator